MNIPFEGAAEVAQKAAESIGQSMDRVGQSIQEMTQKQKQLLKDTLDFEIAVGKRNFEEKAMLVGKERELAVAGSSNELKLRREVASVQLEIFRREEELAQKRFNNNEILMQEWLESQKARFEEMGEAGGLVVEEIKRKTQDLGLASIDTAGVMHNAFRTTFSSMMSGAKTLKENVQGFFRSMADGMINEMARVMANQAVSALFGGVVGSGGGNIFGSIGGLFSGLFGGMGGGGALTTPSATIHRGGIAGDGTGVIRMVNPAVFAHAPRLHSGLTSNEFPAILEKGEEVLTRKDPRHRNNMGSRDGVTINQTLQINTGVSATVRAEIMSLMPQIAEATKMAVADSSRRGGDFRKAFK